MIDVDESLKKAIEANQQQRKRLLEGSRKDGSGLADGLAPFGGDPINVYLTKPCLIKEVSLNPNAIATVMRDSTGYLIFIDEERASRVRPFAEKFALRFTVFHEYAHIINGDVFEDQDDIRKAKLVSLTPRQLRKHWELQEELAKKYATARLGLELIEEYGETATVLFKSRTLQSDVMLTS